MISNIRKIQLVGNRSYSISLPKDWIIENKLKEQDKVYIERTGQNNILISTVKTGHKTEIEINIESIEDISEFIKFCYVKNIDKIILKSKNIDYDKSVEIKQIVNLLEGYNIISEDKDKIVIAFLFKDILIRIEDIHKRMLYMLNNMIEAIQNKDIPTVESMERDIDRMYHLSKKTIISCMNDSTKQKENNIESWEELFFLRDVSKKLEKIGDSIHSIRNEKLTNLKEKNLRLMIESISTMLSTKKDKYKEIHKAKEALDIVMKSKEVSEDITLHKIHDRCKDIYDNIIAIEYNKRYFQ